jgi:hypothetical protein
LTHNDRHLRLGEVLADGRNRAARAGADAWAAILLCAVVWGGRPFVPDSARWPWVFAALIVTLISSAALGRGSVAEDRSGARRLGLGPAGLQLGKLELRLLAAALLCAVFLTLILSVVALVLLATFGIAGLDAEAIRLRNWAAVGPAWKLVLLALMTVGMLCAIVVLAARLSLFVPATVARRHMVSLQSIALSRGVVGPMAVGLILTAAPSAVLLVAAGAGWISGAGAWIAWAAVLNLIQGPLTLGFLGAVYRRLEPLSPLEGAHG